MAKIKFGMMMTDARGKLGGQVFSKNRAGAYVRTKVTPTNPRTEAQMLSRSILASLSIGWNALTDAARKSFNGAVADWQKTDIFGDLKSPTGKNLYVGLNKNLAGSGQALVSAAPEKVEIPAILNPSVAVDTAGSEIDLSVVTVPVGMVLQVSATPPLNQGVNFVENRLRVISNLPAGAVASAALFTAYAEKFGTLTAGANVHFRLKYIASNGQAGVPVIVKSVVAP